MPKGIYLRSKEQTEKLTKRNRDTAHTRVGVKVHTEKFKIALIQRNKGNKHGLGYRHSKDSIEKIVHSKKGKKRPPFSKEWRENMGRAISKRQMGSNNPAWKGGISTENNRVRHSPEYKLWRAAVFQRDGFLCIWGGIEHGKNIEADHIKPFAHYPELRFAIDNGRTLCHNCHKTTVTYGFRGKKSIV